MFSNDGTQDCSQIATQKGDVNILQQTKLQSSSAPQADVYYGSRNPTYLQLVIRTRPIASATTAFASINCFRVAVGVDVFQESGILSTELLKNANSIARCLISKSFAPNFQDAYPRDLPGNPQMDYTQTTSTLSATGLRVKTAFNHWKEFAPVNSRALRRKSHDAFMFMTYSNAVLDTLASSIGGIKIPETWWARLLQFSSE